MRQTICAISVILFSTGLAAAQSGAFATVSRNHPSRNSGSDGVATKLSTMQDSINAQEQQIQKLIEQVQTRDQEIDQLKQQISRIETKSNDAQQKVTDEALKASQQQQEVRAVKNDLVDLKSAVTNSALALQETQKTMNESPLALRFKGVTITPGGFLAAETVTRQRAMAADVNTPFNSIPFSAANSGQLSEFYGSGRQSRLTLKGEGSLKNMHLTGYWEMDWLGAGVTSNNNQSNSYLNRQRQLWGQVAWKNGLSVTGGQMWSLVTETKKGMDNLTEALPMSIDAQYVVGFSWARQFGFRVTKDFNHKFWIGAALENPQTTFANPSNSPNNFLLGNFGNGGGLYNGGGAAPAGAALTSYSFNAMPDVTVKAAMEPGFGHYELFGVVSRFRDRIYPNAGAASPTATGAYNDSVMGGGIGANARLTVRKKFDFGLHFMGGDGVGRYGTSSLPDATVHPDGTLALLHSYQGLGTFEVHTNKWDWYFNGGGEYVGKAAYLNSGGKLVGYGSSSNASTGCGTEVLPGAGGFLANNPSNCSVPTRSVFEGTFGFWFKPYNGAKGKLQFGPQYEYLVRNTWAGTGGSPRAIENVVLTSFRYYLP